MTITLDPGHGRYANRGVINGYYEGTRMFLLAGYLRDELVKYGAQVVITRGELEDDPTLAQRGQTAAESGSELFISLHSNAADSAAAHGVSLFRSIQLNGSIALGKRLADAVVRVMREQTGKTYLRGVMTRTYVDSSGDTVDYYGVIRSAVRGGDVKYAYIIEHGFHTNEEECRFLFSDANLRLLAVAEAEVIANYFSLVPADTPPEMSPLEYIVKKGDTLSRIAAAYSTTYQRLAEYNSIENPNLIRVGQRIVIPADTQPIKVGDTVRIKPYKTSYVPGGREFSDWVLDYDYIISKTTDSRGAKVYRNGYECVLLGKKVNRSTGALGGAINSWCSIDYLTKVK